MSDREISTFRLSDEHKESLDSLVEEGAYESRTEAIIDAMDQQYEGFEHQNLDDHRPDLDKDALYNAAVESFSIATALSEKGDERYDEIRENAFQHLIENFPRRDFFQRYVFE